MADQTSGSIDIAAPPETVMAVITDIEQYPVWVDSMSSAEILTSRNDRPETVRIVLDHPVVQDDYVLRYAWAPAVVSWRLVRGRLLKTMDGSYTVEPKGAGSTVTYRLTVDANLPMIGMFRRKAERTIIDGALQGLKRRVEA